MEALYQLLKNLEDPTGIVYAGVRKTEKQWMARIALLNPGDCDKKKDWFERVEHPMFNTSDMISFSRFCLIRFAGNIPDDDLNKAFQIYLSGK